MSALLRGGGVAAVLLLLAAHADAAPSRFVINRVNVLAPLRAEGTEPFWNVEITRSGFKWSSPETLRLRGSHGRPKLTPGKAVWRGRMADGRMLRVTVTAGTCSDGMSDVDYPLTARVQLGNIAYEGCAASVGQFDTPGT